MKKENIYILQSFRIGVWGGFGLSKQRLQNYRIVKWREGGLVMQWSKKVRVTRGAWKSLHHCWLLLTEHWAAQQTNNRRWSRHKLSENAKRENGWITKHKSRPHSKNQYERERKNRKYQRKQKVHDSQGFLQHSWSGAMTGFWENLQLIEKSSWNEEIRSWGSRTETACSILGKPGLQDAE